MKRRWLVPGLIVALALIAAPVALWLLFGGALDRQIMADNDLRNYETLELRVVQQETGGYTAENPLDPPLLKVYSDSPEVRALYRVLRTRRETEFGPGGCRIVGRLAGVGAKAYNYQVTFLHDDKILFDGYLRPECIRYTLTKNDSWYLKGLTNSDSYSPGTYVNDPAVRNAFIAATGLPY